MRCRQARRRLSDALDGALPAGRAARLEAHLKACPACRGYREGLVRIQARSRLAVERPAGSWRSFEERLAAKLALLEKGSRPAGVPFAARRRWAWAGVAAAVILAGLTALFVLQRPRPAALAAWAGYEDVLDPLVRAAESDPELASRIVGEVTAQIEDLAPLPDPEAEAVVLPASDPLFWEGLSDGDLRAIVTELEADSGHGGPR